MLGLGRQCRLSTIMWRNNFRRRERYCGLEDGLILNHHRRLSARLDQLLFINKGSLPTLCRLPESLRRASSPPGPMLLLRAFFVPGLDADTRAGASAMISVWFSLLPIISADEK